MSDNGDLDRIVGEVVTKLNNFDFIHSILLFGSTARGEAGRDIDICIIQSRELSFRERLSLDALAPDVDISLFFELPVHIRKRIFEDAKVLYSVDRYYLLTLIKETDFEYSSYKKYREYYHKAMQLRVKNRVEKGVVSYGY